MQLLRGKTRRRGKAVGGQRLLTLKCMGVGYTNEMKGDCNNITTIEVVNHR